MTCVPQRNTEPGADAALRQPRFLLARHGLNGRNVDAAVTLKPLETPGRSERQRVVRPATGCIDPVTAPAVGSAIQQRIIGSARGDIAPVHALVAPKLLEPLPDFVGRPIERRID